jgi:hypothetical protein
VRLAPYPHAVVAQPAAQEVVERLDHRVAGHQHPQPAAAMGGVHVARALAPWRAGAQAPFSGPGERDAHGQRAGAELVLFAAARAARRPHAELEQYAAEPPAVADPHAHRTRRGASSASRRRQEGVRTSAPAVRPSGALATNRRTRRSQRHVTARGRRVSAAVGVTVATGPPFASAIVTGTPGGAWSVRST